MTTKPKATAAPKPARKKSTKPPASSVDALCATIVSALDDNKGEEIVALSLIGKCSFADAMVVASGRSPRHVSALADHVADAIKKAGYNPPPIEGKDTGDWVLIDAGDVVVHIFRPEVRQFYNIEKMWSAPAMPEA